MEEEDTVFSLFLGKCRSMEILALENRERVTMGGKREMKFKVKLHRSLGWLQMHLPQIVCEFSQLEMTAGEVFIVCDW